MDIGILIHSPVGPMKFTETP